MLGLQNCEQEMGFCPKKEVHISETSFLCKGVRTQADKVQKSVTISRMFPILDIFASVRLPQIWNLKIRNNLPNRGGLYRPIRNKIKY